MTTHITTTKAGTKFVLNNAITYGQHLELVALYLNKKEDDSIISAKANELGFSFVVVSINDSTEDLYKTFRDLPYPDVKPIVDEISDILDPKV